MITKYNLYLDESGEHSYKGTRWLCLCGIIIEHEHAINNIPYHFDGFKKDKNIENLTLHLEDIKRNKNGFEFLSYTDMRTRFYEDLASLLMNINFQIIAIVIDKEEMKRRYGNFADDPYHYSFKLLIENFVSFLNRYRGIGKVHAESRSPKLDRQLNAYLADIHTNGTFYSGCSNIGRQNYSPLTIQKVILSKNIKFFNKKDVVKYKINGLEIADLLCNPVLQIIKDKILTYLMRDKSFIGPTFLVRKFSDFEKNILNEQIINPRRYFFGWKP